MTSFWAGCRKCVEAFFPDPRLLWIVIVGFAVRLALAPWTSWTYDTFPFYQGIVDQLAGIGPYGHMAYSYPPAFAFVEYPFSLLLSLFVDPSQWISFQPSLVEVGQVTDMVVPMVTAPWFNLFFKLPLIITDYLTAVLLYHFVMRIKGDRALARRVFILWFLNPLVLFVSSIYGNFDVLAVFFSVLALYAMYRRMYLSAGLSIGLGVAFKLFPLYLGLFFFAFLFGLVLIERRPYARPLAAIKDLSKYIVGGVLGLSSILITAVVNPTIMVFLTGRASNNDMGGINLWGLARTVNAIISPGQGVTSDEFSFVTIITNYLMFFILFVILIIVFIMFRNPREGNERLLLFGTMFVFVVLLLFQPVTHAHYLIWVLPFMLLCSLYQPRFEVKVAMLSIAGVVFWFGLQSYLAFFYPLSVHTGIVPTAVIDRTVVDYYTGSYLVTAEGGRLVPTVLGVTALVTAALPEGRDPLHKLAVWWAGRKHEA